MRCSWCRQNIVRDLRLKEILLPGLIPKFERCWRCEKKLVKIQVDACCPTCCKKDTKIICEDCRLWKKLYPTYDFQHQALFEYNDGFQEWIQRYKILGDLQCKAAIAPEIYLFLKKAKTDFIIPIPLSLPRMQQRGFNQVEEILKLMDLPFACFLVRNEHFKPQAEKSRRERLAMAQPFCCRSETKKIHGKNVLLVDDIYTTGRTIFYAAECLQNYQPKSIRTFSFAR